MKVKSEFLLVKKLGKIKVHKNLKKHNNIIKNSSFFSSQSEALVLRNIKNKNSRDFGIGGYGVELI